MEITGRADLGIDLHAPAADDAGREHPTYALVKEVRDGEIVLHYETPRRAITAWSIADGGFWEAEVIWGSLHGPNGIPVIPYPREGLWHGLRGPFPLGEPLTIEELSDSASAIGGLFADLEKEHGRPLYLPFQIRRDGLRATQGYLTKMPSQLIEAFPGLRPLLALRPTDSLIAVRPSYETGEADLGQRYNRAATNLTRIDGDPFSFDPAVVERGLRRHAWLQNLLADEVIDKGHEPRSPGPEDPPWDLLWQDGETTWVTEVKSMSSSNEERQLRLGLGQLLRYRQRLEGRNLSIKAVLLVETQPADSSWQTLCESLEILLLWPEAIDSSLS
jgi:hypothetical protein